MSLGTVAPTSAQAFWMQRTIRAVESNSVPSQSKTIRSNFFKAPARPPEGRVRPLGGQRTQ